jgi:hypothetical protein
MPLAIEKSIVHFQQLFFFTAMTRRRKGFLNHSSTMFFASLRLSGKN